MPNPSQTRCYWRVKRFSLWNSHYLYLDTEDLLAEKLFAQQGLQVWCDRYCQDPNSPYRAVFCHCRKTSRKALERALGQLPARMVLSGRMDYLACCEALGRKMAEPLPKPGKKNAPRNAGDEEV